MALAIRQARRQAPWGVIVATGLLVVVLGGISWYTVRWYMHGDPLPVTVPIFVTADPSVDESEVTPAQVQQHQVGPDQPRYLSIPSLDVHARIYGAGTDQTGALAAPANLSDVTWFDESSMPGAGGVMLMDGHNGGITRDGVFAQLHSLQSGAQLEVERGDGQVFTYEVRENQSMELSQVNETGMKMMMESAEPGQEALNIITCDGVWVPRYQQFDRRIMLRAVRVE